MPAPEFYTRAGDLTPYALACGYVQEYGEHVTLCWDSCVYAVKRSPRHPAGWTWQNAHTLADARKLARRLGSETSPK